MKKTLVIFTLFNLLALSAFPAFASGSVSYVGSDLSSTDSTLCTNFIDASNAKFFTTSKAASIWKTSFTAPENDCINIAGSNTLTLSGYKGYVGSLDTLGFTDMLLSLGIYNADAKVVNTNDLMSLSEALQGYSDLYGYSIPSSRLKDVKNEYDLYQKVTKESGSQKVSQMFFMLEKYAMEDPDTHIATRTIVDAALKSNGIKISKDTTTALYNWEYNYIVDGNNWTGFFRSLNESTDKNGNIYIYYGQLQAAPDSSQTSLFGNKVGTLIFFFLAVLIIGGIIYNRKKSLSK